MVAVTLRLPGASADELERHTVRVIEEALRALADVDGVRSATSEGAAEVRVDFAAGVEDAALRVHDALARATPALPRDADVPIVTDLTGCLQRWLVVDHMAPALAPDDAYRLGESLRWALERTPGVRAASLCAGSPELRVELSPSHLAALGLAATDVVRALEGGLGELRPNASLESLVLAERGAPVRLADVAVLVRGRGAPPCQVEGPTWRSSSSSTPLGWMRR
ncbi:MAG: efflux RND transporter permease subunit [Myxococcota bacterium]